MKFGPIQLVMIEFDSNQNFKGAILEELENIRGRDIVRIIDGLFLMKDQDGNILQIEKSDLSVDEALAFGDLIARMMGLDAGGDVSVMADAYEVVEDSFGFGPNDLRQIKDRLKPGTSTLILLIEHMWATRLKSAIGNAGGRLVTQGMLTSDALMMVGKELDVIAEAEITLELAEAVKGAALLDALGAIAEARYIEAVSLMEAEAAVEMARAVKADAAAEVVRTLVVAGMIEQAAVEKAIEVLTEAELIESSAVSEAQRVVETNQQEIQEIRMAQDVAS